MNQKLKFLLDQLSVIWIIHSINHPSNFICQSYFFISPKSNDRIPNTKFWELWGPTWRARFWQLRTCAKLTSKKVNIFKTVPTADSIWFFRVKTRFFNLINFIRIVNIGRRSRDGLSFSSFSSIRLWISKMWELPSNSKGCSWEIIQRIIAPKLVPILYFLDPDLIFPN